MRPIFRTAVDVAAHAFGTDRHPFERFGPEALLERLLERRHAEHTIAARSGHRHADLGAALGYEHANESVTRSRVGKLDVGSLAHLGKLHLGDDLIAFERGLEQAL